MFSIHFTAALAISIFYISYLYLNQKITFSFKKPLPCLMGVALLIRVLYAYFYHGFDTDISCFAAWSERILEVGPAAFYASDVFTDYPPGYMYILYVIAAIRKAFDIPYLSGMHLVLLKMPSIISDLLCGYLLYKTTSKKHSAIWAFSLTVLYLFNPVILLNSALWGQVDSVFTLTLVLMCLYIGCGKMLPAYIAYGFGILLKPQMLVFTPLILIGFLDWVILNDFSAKKLLRNISNALYVFFCGVLLCLPFGLDKVFSQYFSTLGSYPYAAVNAYNFWGLFGLNWVSQDHIFLFLPCKTWGTIVIFFIVIVTFIISLKTKETQAKYPLIGAFIILTMFVFSVRMHERYMYPGIILLLFAFIYKPIKPLYLCFSGFSFFHFYNTAHVMFHYDPQNYDRRAPIILFVSAGMILCVLYLYSVIVRFYLKDNGTQMLLTSAKKDSSAPNSKIPGGQTKSDSTPTPSAKNVPFRKPDWILLIAITVIYSVFALYDLGDTSAPQNSYEISQQEAIELDFGEKVPVSLSYYLGPSHNIHFAADSKFLAEDSWTPIGEITLETVFTWKNISLENASRYLRLTLNDSSASILELIFLDAEGNILMPLNRDEYTPLFDEANLYPARSSFRNSMYFDEIYHARTAYEFLHHMYSYENTHPPLGKILISLGVAMFGMTPFGWRIIGTVFGILMVPITYLFGKRFTGNTAASALACSLFAFDFMHFTQTRIATIDVYITFFVLLMYFFMYEYSKLSFYDTPLYKTWIPLGICGICMGLGIASKWTGVYAGAGLAIIFFNTLYRRMCEYRFALSHPRESTEGISHAHIINCFIPYTKKTIFFCIGSFVCVPALIYLLSYIPFNDLSGKGLFTRMLNNQTLMLGYHSDLNVTHPFSSHFYEWPLISRPIWYFSGIVSDTLREGISAFGNPLVWWIGIPAFLYMIYLALHKKDKPAAFLIIGYLAQYLPWFFVSRITFIYHYFPSVFFVVMMIVYSIMQWKDKLSKRSFLLLIVLYGLAAFILFLLFYPVLSGQPVESNFVDKWLRWFDSWVLTAR